MKKILTILVFTTVFSFGEDFISPYEYGKMLYQNPRGIGCDKCHGIKGNGETIATYKHNGEKKEIIAPSINNISENKFIKKMDEDYKIMPKYFLTKNEIRSLYYYLNKTKDKK